jgi:hypothetical protein
MIIRGERWWCSSVLIFRERGIGCVCESSIVDPSDEFWNEGLRRFGAEQSIRG